VRRWQKRFYLLGYVMNRGHNPKWTITNFFNMAQQYPPERVVVETTNYQATLKWLMEEAMQQAGQYYRVEGFDDKVKKYQLINQSFSEIATERNFFCRPGHTEFIEQFEDYPNVTHDDVVNAVAIAMKKLREIGDIYNMDGFLQEEEEIPPLGDFRNAP